MMGRVKSERMETAVELGCLTVEARYVRKWCEGKDWGEGLTVNDGSVLHYVLVEWIFGGSCTTATLAWHGDAASE